MAPQRTAANQPAGQVLPLLASAHRMICGAVYFLARPVSGMRTYSRYADNNFAKMRSRGHVPVRRLRLIEGEYLTNAFTVVQKIALTAIVDQADNSNKRPLLGGGPMAKPPCGQLGRIALQVRPKSPRRKID